MIDALRCERCNFGYKSALTVFADKDLSYESKCPKCSHVNKKTLTRESIRDAEQKKTGKEDGAPSTHGARDRKRIPKILERAETKGLYLAVASVAAYILGSLLVMADHGTLESPGHFLLVLSYPAFGLGISLLLFRIAHREV